MEFVCIEAKTFMEMNEALEAVVKKMRKWHIRYGRLD
jgi:hypothetical protein